MKRIKRLPPRRSVVWLTRLAVLAAVGVGCVMVTEEQHNRFYRRAQSEGAVIDTRWGGPDVEWLRRLSYRHGFEIFIRVEEIYVGAAPSDARIKKCIPVTANVYSLANRQFDDASLCELIRLLPNPDDVRVIRITNCAVTADGLKCLATLGNLKEVLWVQPSATEEEVSSVSQGLPFKVFTVRPETCKPFTSHPPVTRRRGPCSHVAAVGGGAESRVNGGM
jgi:hypothetical protein